jgi:putative holliday junction resolvase
MAKTSTETLLALDVGEKRIGVAKADTAVRLAFPLTTLTADGNELQTLRELVQVHHPTALVVGYPRNQQGEATAQTRFVERFATTIEPLGVPIIYQDESLTSVVAEERLQAQGKPYTKADIDSYAAVIILTDYLEAQYGY